MENVRILRKGVNEKAIAVDAPKKLKTRAMDFINIKNTPVTMQEANPVIEETRTKVEEPIDESEEPKVVKEVVEDKPIEEDNMGVFAYSAKKAEEEINPATIKEIKELEKTYKGQPKVEQKKPVVEKKQESKITTEDFETALSKESYSASAREYKDYIKHSYNAIKEEIESNKRKLENILSEYSKEQTTGEKLKTRKEEAEKVMNGINSLSLDFLVDIRRNATKANEALNNLEDLFNEYRKVAMETAQEIKNCDERKKEIGKKEQAIRENGVELNKKKTKFEEDNYEKITNINTIDDETRELNKKLADATGIKDRELKVKIPERTPENRVPVANVTNNIGETYNPFNGVRVNSVNPETVSARRAA